ncbi:hypothetical protein KFL_002860200 [Klebsormidium nitens]|uniref:Protein Asterix n=1 Tax=Klebsormidium nitens TaxID=105231 RepID=A0A1Y1ICG0_KLENI|nr:hypothetical protein KFL_002860200 [Klebsormidium nitens]|eukprot:GAQ86396.1 hypothetical protein KFL_002860200 [Klebsormidium nitens]
MAPSSRSASFSSAADPRDPSAAVPYKAPKIKEEDLPPSWFGLLAILTGVFGILIRMKIFTWISFFFSAAALANIRYMEQEMKQIIPGISFGVMGILMNYFMRPPGQAG